MASAHPLHQDPVSILQQALGQRKIGQPCRGLLQGRSIVQHLADIRFLRRTLVLVYSSASNSSTSPSVAWVPSMRLESTTSCAVYGESRTSVLGMPCSTPS